MLDKTHQLGLLDSLIVYLRRSKTNFPRAGYGERCGDHDSADPGPKSTYSDKQGGRRWHEARLGCGKLMPICTIRHGEQVISLDTLVTL